jgi:hypothetical protein
MRTPFFPPYAILKGGIARSDDETTVTMSRELFHFLIAAAAAPTFDPEWYRNEYPDVVEPIEDGALIDEIDHYAQYGYEEGRIPRSFVLDEAWFLEAYGDVSDAAASGEVASVGTFYNHVGYLEGRATDEKSEAQAQRWREAIERSADAVGLAHRPMEPLKSSSE